MWDVSVLNGFSGACVLYCVVLEKRDEYRTGAPRGFIKNGLNTRPR